MEKRLIFRPEDFSILWTIGVDPSPTMAMLANEKLSALIKDWPMIYLSTEVDGEIKYGSTIDGVAYNAKAYLAFIEPIEREPCKHEPKSVLVKVGFGNPDEEQIICRHCSVELTATWSEKK